MKTLLAIALLAAGMLTVGAPVTPISGTAVAGGNIGPQYWCGAVVCPPKKTYPRTHRGW
jgi:hypothetical protein